jgi:putative membrane protein
MMGWMGGWMGGAMGLCGFLWLVIGVAALIAIVLAALWLARRVGGDPAGSGSGALAELERRYARGEVDRDAYLQMRRDLGGQ